MMECSYDFVVSGNGPGGKGDTCSFHGVMSLIALMSKIVVDIKGKLSRLIMRMPVECLPPLLENHLCSFQQLFYGL